MTAECPRDELRLSFDGLQALAAGRFRYIHEGASASPGSGHRSGASDEPLHQFVSLLLESARMGGARGAHGEARTPRRTSHPDAHGRHGTGDTVRHHAAPLAGDGEGDASGAAAPAVALELDALARSLFAALGIGLLLLDERRRVCFIDDVMAQALALDGRTVLGAPVERVLPKAWAEGLGIGLGGDGPPSAATPSEPGPRRFTVAPSGGAAREYALEVRRLDVHALLLVALRTLDTGGDRPPSCNTALPSSGAAAAPSPLSPREREVLSCIAAGATTKDIAEQLGIAPTTVETYRRQIMSKLQLRTIAELTKYAVREKLTPP